MNGVNKMEPEEFLEELSTFAQSEGGVQKLRDLILQLAVQGKLVPQDPSDEPANVLLERIAAEKARLVAEKKIPKPKVLPPIEADEVPFAVPEGWFWTRLGAVGKTQTGATPKKALLSASGPKVPFVRPNDIRPNGVDTSREEVPRSAAEATGRLVQADAVLMGCIGTIGKAGICRTEATFNQQINAIEAIDVDPGYIALSVRAPFFQSACWGSASATTIAILNKGKWENLPIPIPPLAEQHRIVAKVDALMALCDDLEARLTAMKGERDALAATNYW